MAREAAGLQALARPRELRAAQEGVAARQAATATALAQQARALKDSRLEARLDAVLSLKANLQALLTASNIKAPVTWSCISEDDEAQYEFKAVEYATKCAGHAAPTANIGMGSGSVQLVAYDAKNRYGACMPHSATACPCPISRGV